MADFREVQTDKPTWTLVIVIGTALLITGQFLATVVFGWAEGPAWLLWPIFILVGLLLPAFYALNRMIVTVGDDGVRVTFVPMTSVQYAYADIAKVEAREYKPLREFGGWGLRFRGNRRAFSMRGNLGVELTLKNGEVVLIGSADPEPLERAIKAAMRKRR